MMGIVSFAFISAYRIDISIGIEKWEKIFITDF